MRGGASADGGGSITAIEAAVTGAAVLAYTLTMRRYGLDLIDEGTLLAQFADVARGGAPYRDFQTSYGPLAFYWNGAVLRWIGMDVTSVRTALALVHATGAALLYAIARRVGGRRVAVVGLVLVWGMLRPLAPGTFALFNVPYPGWYAEVLGYGAVLLLVGAPAASGRLVLVGALWALAFLAKQNVGLLGLAGTVVHLAIADRPDRAGRGWGALLALGMLAGIGVLCAWSPMTWTELVALGTPIVLLAAAVLRARPGARFVRGAALATVGFVAVLVPALGGMAAVVGPKDVMVETLQLGREAAQGFRLTYPTPAEVLGAAWRHPGGWLSASRTLVDQLWLLALPVVSVVGAWRLAHAPRTEPVGRVALTAVGALWYLQVYPRADQWHALAAAGLLVVLALVLVQHQAGRLGRGVTIGLVALALARSAPTVPVIAQVLRAPPADATTVAHASLRWDLMRPAYLTRLPDVAAALGDVRSLFGFPALAFLNFVTGAPSPARHDYFFPGFPGPAGIEATMASLRADPPDAVVLLDAPVAFSQASFAAHPALVALLRSDRWMRTPMPPYEIGRRATP